MPALSRLPDRWWTPALAALLVAALFVAARLAENDGDASRFVIAAVPQANPDATPPGLFVHRDVVGYDGEFYYRLALDPLTTSSTDHGIHLDAPAYRQQRIAYPVIAWLVSLGGRPRLLPWTLVGVNIVALTALGALSGALARDRGHHAIEGVTIALAPGTAVALARDTGEIVAGVALVGGLLLLAARRSGRAGATLGLAALARETALLAPIGVVIAVAISRLRRRSISHPGPLVASSAIAIAIWLTWELNVWRIWGGTPPVFSGASPGKPVLGLLEAVVDLVGRLSWEPAFELGSIAFVLVFLSIVARYGVRRRGAAYESWIFAGAALVTLLLTKDQWNSHLGHARASVEAIVVGSVLLLEAPGRLPRLARWAVPVMWIATAALNTFTV